MGKVFYLTKSRIKKVRKKGQRIVKTKQKTGRVIFKLKKKKGGKN